MSILKEKINHIVVLMMENRSFDSLLGNLYPKSDNFNGLSGDESNIADGTECKVWNGIGTPIAMNLPNPDPGELFTDINEQLFGTSSPELGAIPTMCGFAQNYGKIKDANSADIMHYYLPSQVPTISTLAKNYAVCDGWFASAPCQTWPNRFFIHTATAGGYENNSPVHFPYLMPSIFTRFNSLRFQNGWKVYYHDFPNAALLSDLWHYPDQFKRWDHFISDAASGNLPCYSFLEPRYMPGVDYPNDEHPPHNILFGEELIAEVYNTLQSSPKWKETLLVITFDEHGGCYDHVPPPPAIPPEDPSPGQVFAFDRYGVRIPTLVISPYIAPGTVFRAPPGSQPFDHTSIIATLRERFDLGDSLTSRDENAPTLTSLLILPDDQLNLGAQIIAESAPRDPDFLSQEAQKTMVELNDLQKAMITAAAHLPDFSPATTMEEIHSIATRLTQKFMATGPMVAIEHENFGAALRFVESQMQKFSP